jgi:hypothetical protein
MEIAKERILEVRTCEEPKLNDGNQQKTKKRNRKPKAFQNQVNSKTDHRLKKTLKARGGTLHLEEGVM